MSVDEQMLPGADGWGDDEPEDVDEWPGGRLPVFADRVVWCWSCSKFHDPPKCAPSGSDDGDGEMRVVVPPWHDRRKARDILFGWSSDHEWARTSWPRSDRYL